MADGVLVTVPEPVPLLLTFSVWGPWNVAVTLRACVIETVQAPVPVHAPLQPVKPAPALGVGVNVTDVPDG